MSERQGWAEERLVSYLLDTLPENQAQEVEEILGEVEEYREILEGRGPDEIGHLPAALLARWQKMGLHIVGVERVLILQHLEACSSCREELELVGGSLTAWAEAPESAPHEPMGRRPSSARTTERPHWTAWLGGGVLGIAAGILLMLNLSPGDDSADDLHGIALPVIVPQTVRSDNLNELQLTDARAPVLLALVVPRLEEDHEAELLVRDPSGMILSRTALRLGPQSERTTQIVLRPKSGWSAGKHTIELTVVGETETRDLGNFTVGLEP